MERPAFSDHIDIDCEKNDQSFCNVLPIRIYVQQVKTVRNNTDDQYADYHAADASDASDAQNRFGYIPEAIVDLMAYEMELFSSYIYEVATFYSQFTFIPKGKIRISVC